jgi:hypothetical protein
VDDLVAFLESLTDKDFLTNPGFSDPFATQGAQGAGDKLLRVDKK